MSHGRTLRVATDWVDMTGLCADDRYLMVNPYFHMFGLKAGILACVASGATMLPEPVFDVDRVLARVEREKVTVLPGSPTIYQAILDHPDRGRRDLSSLRVAVTGAADIPVELIRRVDDELPFSTVITGYGLTEAGTAAATSGDDDVETIATTVGRPRPGFEVRIVDGDDAGRAGRGARRDPPPRRQRDGRLPRRSRGDRSAPCRPTAGCARATSGSSTRPAACASSAAPRTCSSWAASTPIPPRSRTSSCGTPTSRRPPSSGSRTTRLGEVGMAFVVPRSAGTSSAAIIDWCRDQMANYKVPRAVELVDELPINATGKVVKDLLRERVVPGRSGVDG